MAEISFCDVIFFTIVVFFPSCRSKLFFYRYILPGIIVFKYRLTNMTSPQFEIQYQHTGPKQPATIIKALLNINLCLIKNN